MMSRTSDYDGDSIRTLTAASTESCRMIGRCEYDDEASQLSIFVRIFVAEFNVQKCLQFPPTTGIWEVKQKLFATLPKELKDSLNYGLFCPPFNGRAGKFLDDERTLNDYPLPGNVGYLELKYKRRVYKMMNLDEKALKQLHTKSNLRKFIDYVLSGQADKITKMCARGLDPNFHDLDNGETPLSLATTLKEPVPVLAALTNGGAHLDFRTLDGCTALHRAAQHNSFKALQGLLELGSSANYKDSKGLTPLYYAVTHAQDPNLIQALLYDYALTGAVDSQGWQEIHHACRNGHVRHLEHLIFYGADIDARNATGNTPLHVCAVNNQDSCARVLLFRGADKNVKNYANQTAYHVAIIAGAMELAEVIRRHTMNDIVPLREKPNYNPRRRPRSRSPGSMISRTNSVSRLNSRSPSVFSNHGPLASPSPSSRSYPMFSTSDSVSSGGSNGDTNGRLHHEDTSGIVTDKSSCSDESTSATHAHVSRVDDHLQKARSSYARTAYAEKLRSGETEFADRSSVKSVPAIMQQRADSAFSDSLTCHSREPSPVHRVGLIGLPRTVTLARGAQGYGFVLRGSKSGNLAVNRELQVVSGDNPPALQYLDEVDHDGPAHNAGLLAGDFLLSINGEDVRTYPHERAVNLIRHAQHTVTLTVMTPPRGTTRHSSGSTKNRSVGNTFRRVGSSSAMAIPAPPRRDPRTSLTIGPERSKSYVGLNDIGSYDTITNENVKIASIRPRPVSKRITASEIEDLLVRQGNQAKQQSSALSSFTPAPLRADGSVGSSSSRVFNSVAQMKRQRAVLQQQRRRTDVVPSATLHKDYHSTPDLQSNESETGDPESEDAEELYSDTTLFAPQNDYRSVPTTPQNNPTYSRPMHAVPSSTPKPAPSSNSRQVTYPEIHQRTPAPPSAQTTFSRPHMKPSMSMDERSLNSTSHSHTSQPVARTLVVNNKENTLVYAAPDDPEPDYFSDEDRMSYGSSSGRSSSKPPLPVVSTTTNNNKQPVQRMSSMPPPPPPPPAPTANTGDTNSFASAIAKAAQARRAVVENPSTLATPTSAGVSPLLKSTPLPEPKKDDFQSELQRALKRRSNERDVEAVISEARRNSTDVDTFNLKDPTENLSTVKDRISFLERQAVLGPRMVRLSGITTDQSSTDMTESLNSPSGNATLRTGTQYRQPPSMNETDEGTANRFGVRNSVTGRYDDAASIHSQSSASTFSSGYESPTLKYGSSGEQLLWTQGQTKFTKRED